MPYLWGHDCVQKDTVRLFVAGLAMVASPAVAAFVRFLWAQAIVLALTGIYLITWATLGRGYWCRECKKFSLLARGRTGV